MRRIGAGNFGQVHHYLMVDAATGSLVDIAVKCVTYYDDATRIVPIYRAFVSNKFIGYAVVCHHQYFL